MQLKPALVFVTVILLLSACGSSLPEERLDYAGRWLGEEMALYIQRDGQLSYKRIKGSHTTSINAPIREFDGDDFIVGIWFMTTRFEVQQPPQEIDGEWKMTVDGVELTKMAQTATLQEI